MVSRTVHFKTNTLLKDLVGRDLINDDNIAVVELVKNSYDARSPFAKITFNGTRNGQGHALSKIYISDAGVGMDIPDIENKWLNIAYSEKKSMPQKHGHYLAGNKGVGRFSCDRLGERLDLYTRKSNGSLLHLEIEWPDFEISNDGDKIIQDVGVKLSENPKIGVPKTFREDAAFTGTTLVISRLRSDWDESKLLDLKRSLEKFINPNQTFSNEKFGITLNAPEFRERDEGKPQQEKINGAIKNQIFKSLEFRTSYVESEVSPDGALVTTRLFHDAEPVFELEEKNVDFPLLRGIQVVIYYLNPYKKSYFKRQTGMRAIDFGSVFLFLNGFRIAPYGERGDDWLGLDIRKGQGHARYLGSRDLIGRIEISDAHEAFKPISSREGLKRTPALSQLKDAYFFEVLRKLERFVVDGLAWDSISESARLSVRNEDGLDWRSTREDYSESSSKKRRRVASMMMGILGTSPDKAVRFWFNPSLLEGLAEERSQEFDQLLTQLEGFEPTQIDKNLTTSVRRISKALERKEEEVKVARADVAALRSTLVEKTEELQGLASTAESYRAQTLFLQSANTLDANNLRAFHHQIFLESTILGNHISRAVKVSASGARAHIDVAEIKLLLNKATLSNQRIIAITQFATKANFKAGAKKELTDIPAFFEQYLQTVAPEFIGSGINIRVTNKAKAAFEIKTSRIELSIIIDNLISNAGKAMARNVQVQISPKGKDTLEIIFTDDGKGIPKDMQPLDSIFELGVTTTNGSGIGLNYVREVIQAMGGKITAGNNAARGAEFTMEFTR